METTEREAKKNGKGLGNHRSSYTVVRRGHQKVESVVEEGTNGEDEQTTLSFQLIQSQPWYMMHPTLGLLLGRIRHRHTSIDRSHQHLIDVLESPTRAKRLTGKCLFKFPYVFSVPGPAMVVGSHCACMCASACTECWLGGMAGVVVADLGQIH